MAKEVRHSDGAKDGLRERPESTVHNAIQISLTTPLLHNTTVGKEPSLSLTGLWETQIQTTAEMLNKQTNKQYRDRSNSCTDILNTGGQAGILKVKTNWRKISETGAKVERKLPHIL